MKRLQCIVLLIQVPLGIHLEWCILGMGTCPVGYELQWLLQTYVRCWLQTQPKQDNAG